MAIPIPASVREQIVELAVTNTGLPELTSRSGTDYLKPDNFTVHRDRTRPIEREEGRAIVWYFAPGAAGGEQVEYADQSTAQRTLVLRAEIRIRGGITTIPDKAGDDLVTWAVLVALSLRESDLVADARELGTGWDAIQEKQVLGAAAVHFAVEFFTEVGDPTAHA